LRKTLSYQSGAKYFITIHAAISCLKQIHVIEKNI